MGNKISVPIFEKLAILSLLLFQILDIYGYGKLTIGFIFPSILAIYNIVRYKRCGMFDRKLTIYFVYWIIIHVITASTIVEAIPLGIVRLILIYIMFCERIHISNLLRYYRIIGFVCCAFFLLQEVSYATIGIRISGVIPFLPIGEKFSEINFYESERSSSLFSEPAHFVQFILPLFVIELYRKDSKYHYCYAFLILLCLLLTKSGNAIIGIVVVGVFYIYNKVINEKISAKNVFIIMLFIAGVVIGGGRYVASDVGQSLLERKDQLTMDYTTGRSGFLRIYRGFFVYNEMPFVYKIVGNDNPSKLSTYCVKTGLYFEDENDLYFNTFQTFIIRTGILGLVIFSLFLIKLYRNNNVESKCILWIFIALSFISSMHFTIPMCLYILIPYLIKKQQI